MFLGRNTVLWMGVVTAAIGLLQLLFPGIAAAVWAALTALLGAIFILISGSTTSNTQPRLRRGTEITELSAKTGKETGETSTVGNGT